MLSDHSSLRAGSSSPHGPSRTATPEKAVNQDENVSARNSFLDSATQLSSPGRSQDTAGQTLAFMSLTGLRFPRAIYGP